MKNIKLVFATNNAHKLEEVSMILGAHVELLNLKDIGCEEEIPETAPTFEGNALQKAEFIYDRYKCDCFADDSGLEVEALNGLPGIFSARYAALSSTGDSPFIPASGGHDAEANTAKLLFEMENSTSRKAQFRTVIALILAGEKYIFEGIIKGEISREKRGKNGFGYDPVFIPEGYNETFAELSSTLKNKISHRAISVRKLCDFLANLND